MRAVWIWLALLIIVSYLPPIIDYTFYFLFCPSLKLVLLTEFRGYVSNTDIWEILDWDANLFSNGGSTSGQTLCHPTAAKPGHYCIVSSPVDRLWKSDGYFSSDGPGHSYRQHYKETKRGAIERGWSTGRATFLVKNISIHLPWSKWHTNILRTEFLSKSSVLVCLSHASIVLWLSITTITHM